MTHELWVAMLGQTIVIVIAIIGAIKHSEKRLSTVEAKVEHLEVEIGRLPGISRAVSRIEGKLE
jgi:hypothetical protein